MLWLIKKPCEQLLWRVGPVNSGSPYASAVRKDFPAGMRFSSGKYQLDPFIDGNGTQPLLPLLSRFFFMGAVRLTQETPTRGWATGFLQCTGWGAGHNRATSRLDGGRYR